MDGRTAEILRRFTDSWIETLIFYEDLLAKDSTDIRIKKLIGLITQMKQSGADKIFRIGTSLYSLIFSRSVEHGLREDQKFVWIEPVFAEDFEVGMREGLSLYRKYKIHDLNDEKLLGLLETLKHTLID